MMSLLRSEISASSVVMMNRTLAEEHAKYVIVLLELIIFLRVSSSVLGSGTVLFRSEAVIMLFFLGVDQDAVGVGDVLKDFFGSCVKREGYLRLGFYRDESVMLNCDMPF
jgi:hypothetical protein